MVSNNVVSTNEVFYYYVTSFFLIETYTQMQNVCPGWKTAGNQGNKQNFNPTLLTKKLWPLNMRMKQKKISIWKKKNQNGWQKKAYFSKSAVLEKD